MNKIKIKIPWWYKLFIRFMPYFYEDMPEFEFGRSYKIRIDTLTTSFFMPVREGKILGTYDDVQTAYIKIRWKAMWRDFWTMGSPTGIQWVILKSK